MKEFVVADFPGCRSKYEGDKGCIAKEYTDNTQKGSELVLNHVDIYFVSTCRYRFKVLLVSVDKMWSGKWGS